MASSTTSPHKRRKLEHLDETKSTMSSVIPAAAIDEKKTATQLLLLPPRHVCPGLCDECSRAVDCVFAPFEHGHAVCVAMVYACADATTGLPTHTIAHSPTALKDQASPVHVCPGLCRECVEEAMRMEFYDKYGDGDVERKADTGGENKSSNCYGDAAFENRHMHCFERVARCLARCKTGVVDHAYEYLKDLRWVNGRYALAVFRCGRLEFDPRQFHDSDCDRHPHACSCVMPMLLAQKHEYGWDDDVDRTTVLRFLSEKRVLTLDECKDESVCASIASSAFIRTSGWIGADMASFTHQGSNGFGADHDRGAAEENDYMSFLYHDLGLRCCMHTLHKTRRILYLRDPKNWKSDGDDDHLRCLVPGYHFIAHIRWHTAFARRRLGTCARVLAVWHRARKRVAQRRDTRLFDDPSGRYIWPSSLTGHVMTFLCVVDAIQLTKTCRARRNDALPLRSYMFRDLVACPVRALLPHATLSDIAIVHLANYERSDTQRGLRASDRQILQLALQDVLPPLSSETRSGSQTVNTCCDAARPAYIDAVTASGESDYKSLLAWCRFVLIRGHLTAYCPLQSSRMSDGLAAVYHAVVWLATKTMAYELPAAVTRKTLNMIINRCFQLNALDAKHNVAREAVVFDLCDRSLIALGRGQAHWHADPVYEIKMHGKDPLHFWRAPDGTLGYHVLLPPEETKESKEGKKR